MSRSRRLAVLPMMCSLALACSPTEGPLAPSAALGGDPPRWGPWSAPVNLGSAVNSASGEQQPALSKDGLTLYFASNRAGGLGGLDLWVTQRVSLDAPWGTPVHLPAPINSSADDNAPYLTPDKHHLYFHSARPGCGGAASQPKSATGPAGRETWISINPSEPAMAPGDRRCWSPS